MLQRSFGRSRHVKGRGRNHPIRRDSMFDVGWEGLGLLVHDAGTRPTREHAAADLRGLGISSLGQRKSQAVDEKGMIGVWADESRGSA